MIRVVVIAQTAMATVETSSPSSVPGSTSMFCIALSAAGTFRFVMLPVTKPRKEPAVPSIGIKVTTSIKPTVQKIGATPMSPLRTGVIPGHES